MDYQNHYPKRSSAMATGSLILGIVSLATSPCLYLAMACGSLGIILALLSKGGTESLDNTATAGLLLSISGLLLTIVIFTAAIFLMYRVYGGWDGILREYVNMLGVDTMEELYQIPGI